MNWKSQAIMVKLHSHPDDLHQTLNQQDSVLVRTLVDNAREHFESNCDPCKDRNLPCTSTSRKERIEPTQVTESSEGVGNANPSSAGAPLSNKSFVRRAVPGEMQDPFKFDGSNLMSQNTVYNSPPAQPFAGYSGLGQASRPDDGGGFASNASSSSISNLIRRDLFEDIQGLSARPFDPFRQDEVIPFVSSTLHTGTFCPPLSSKFLGSSLSRIASFVEEQTVPQVDHHETASYSATTNNANFNPFETEEAVVTSLANAFRFEFHLNTASQAQQNPQGLHFAYEDMIKELGLSSTDSNALTVDNTVPSSSQPAQTWQNMIYSGRYRPEDVIYSTGGHGNVGLPTLDYSNLHTQNLVGYPLHSYPCQDTLWMGTPPGLDDPGNWNGNTLTAFTGTHLNGPVVDGTFIEPQNGFEFGQERRHEYLMHA